VAIFNEPLGSNGRSNALSSGVLALTICCVCTYINACYAVWSNIRRDDSSAAVQVLSIKEYMTEHRYTTAASVLLYSVALQCGVL
jgi:hypothetical protein